MRRGGTPSLHYQEEPRKFICSAIIFLHHVSDSCREDEKGGGTPSPHNQEYLQRYCSCASLT